jgi:hypothetical protein
MQTIHPKVDRSKARKMLNSDHKVFLKYYYVVALLSVEYIVFIQHVYVLTGRPACRFCSFNMLTDLFRA